MPKRVQMTRSKGGWRKDNPDAVIVARPFRWGNPFVGDRAECADAFKELVDGACVVIVGPDCPVKKMNASWMLAWNVDIRAKAVAELRGKDLACWCPLDGPCHADVLLECANTRPPEASQ